MSILVNKNTRVMVQGITGTQASFHVKLSMEGGTNVVAGVNPHKGGSTYLGVPVFSTVAEAKEQTKADASLMFVPAYAVKEAAREAIEAEIGLVVCIAAGVPVRDMLEIRHMLEGSKTRFIGPNTPGIITPQEARLGIFPENIHTKGCIGLVSSSSTLTYEAVIETNRAGLGQSTVIGLGDDMIIGTGFIDIFKKFMDDDETKAVVMVGGQSWPYEDEGIEFYAALSKKKPLFGFIAGNEVPIKYNLGYASDIMTNGVVTSQDKRQRMIDAGIIVVDNINFLHKELANMFGKK